MRHVCCTNRKQLRSLRHQDSSRPTHRTAIPRRPDFPHHCKHQKTALLTRNEHWGTSARSHPQTTPFLGQENRSRQSSIIGCTKTRVTYPEDTLICESCDLDGGGGVGTTFAAGAGARAASSLSNLTSRALILASVDAVWRASAVEILALTCRNTENNK